VRAPSFHRAHRSIVAWLITVVAAITLLAACHGGPVVDLGPKPPTTDGTISGIVRGPEGTSAIDGRDVEIVNVETGERQHTVTNNAGGFTFKVRPGKYRVQLSLRDGESILKQPDVINVNRSDVDAHADFVVGTARLSRPRFRAPRADDGLGAASA
jgi:carboxypeptidase family protein